MDSENNSVNLIQSTTTCSKNVLRKKTIISGLWWFWYFRTISHFCGSSCRWIHLSCEGIYRSNKCPLQRTLQSLLVPSLEKGLNWKYLTSLLLSIQPNRIIMSLLCLWAEEAHQDTCGHGFSNCSISCRLPISFRLKFWLSGFIFRNLLLFKCGWNIFLCILEHHMEGENYVRLSGKCYCIMLMLK